MYFAKILACFVLSRQDSRVVHQRLIPLQQLSAVPDIEDIAVETPGSKYDDLIEWLKTKGGKVHDKLSLLPSSRGGGYGAFVTGGIEKGEILMTIPRSACITVDDVKNDPESGEIFKKLMEQAGPGGQTVAIAGVMAKERLISEAKDTEGKFGPYLDTLPWKRGINFQEHMLFWSDEDAETLLDGSMCYSEATALRGEVNLAVSVLNKIIGESILEARGEVTATKSGFSLPWEKKPEKLQGLVEGLSEAVKGAFVIILTRAFQDGDGDEEKLVPVLDMLQVGSRFGFP